jgi:hypothetical protein
MTRRRMAIGGTGTVKASRVTCRAIGGILMAGRLTRHLHPRA